MFIRGKRRASLTWITLPVAFTAVLVLNVLNTSAPPVEVTGQAADALAVLLTGLLAGVLGTLSVAGVLLWKRSQLPKAPHQELIASLEDDGTEESWQVRTPPDNVEE